MKLENSFTKENLKSLMRIFYNKAINDENLSEFFTIEFGEDINSIEWEEHINLLSDFWLAMLLNHKTYGGKASGRHFGIANLTRESFIQWMGLFSVSVDEVYVPEISAELKQKGMLLSEEFMRDLNIVD